MTVTNPFVAGQINTTANIACLDMSAPVQAGGAPDGTFHLSPEALLYYCSSRLDSIDQKIQSYFKEQQAKNLASKQLGDVQAILGRTSYQLPPSDPGFNADFHAAEANEILKIYRDATDPKVKQVAAEAFKLRSGHEVTEFGADGTVSAAQIKNAGDDKVVKQDATQWAQRIEDIKSESTSISKSAELNMIQLQSLVSQRQLAVQLTTQLMQSVNESMKNVAANIRG